MRTVSPIHQHSPASLIDFCKRDLVLIARPFILYYHCKKSFLSNFRNNSADHSKILEFFDARRPDRVRRNRLAEDQNVFPYADLL